MKNTTINKPKIQPLESLTTEITKRSLENAVKTSLSKAKRYSENDVVNFQNMQTCFFLSLAVPCFFADMMLPIMDGNGKREIRTMINVLSRGSKLYKLENKFFEFKDENENDGHLDAWFDVEDDFATIIRKFATAIVERKTEMFIKSLFAFDPLGQKEPTPEQRIKNIDQQIRTARESIILLQAEQNMIKESLTK